MSSKEKRFWSNVKKGSKKECWVWTGCKTHGYGHTRFNGKNWRAHRLSYFLFTKKDLKKKWVLHKCDNRPCVNPHHLYLGTALDNARDCIERNRHPFKVKTHCVRGHKFDSENTRIINRIVKRTGRGTVERQCKRCHYIRLRNLRIKKGLSTQSLLDK